ncbi:MAG: hypothetical protein J7L66_03890 [Anaerolineaceae bacterium]|nr:hypothetical protein [Anaerolineaceae bacterium]
MKKINKFLLQYVNKISSVTNRKDKTLNSAISKNIQKEFKQSLDAIASRDYVIRDLFEISVRQSAGYFAALDKKDWDLVQNRTRLELFSIHSDWSLATDAQSAGLRLHRRVYQTSKAKAIITCHPVEIYELVIKAVDFKKLTCLPNPKIFNDFNVLSSEDLKNADSFSNLTFSFRNGLIAWGENLQEVADKIEELIFSAKLALLKSEV